MSTSQPGTNPAGGSNGGPAQRSVGRHARNGRRGPGRDSSGGSEQFMVPRAEFRSYYGRPVIKEPVWKEPDVPAYLFFGGLAGASSALAAAAQLTGRPGLARAAKGAALGGISISTVALINDLGRPARFHHMLRMFKPSSPMSVGSWLLSAYGPAAGAAALSDFTGILPPAGAAATGVAALLGPAVTTYTAVLLCDTAVPAWHEAHREMPYVFAGSAASAAGGFALLAAPSAEAEPARRLAIVGAAVELTAKKLLERRLEGHAEPYQTGRARCAAARRGDPDRLRTCRGGPVPAQPGRFGRERRRAARGVGADPVRDLPGRPGLRALIRSTRSCRSASASGPAQWRRPRRRQAGGQRPSQANSPPGPVLLRGIPVLRRVGNRAVAFTLTERPGRRRLRCRSTRWGTSSPRLIPPPSSIRTR